MADQAAPVYDCIVVGAGYSGLSAAKAIVDQDSSLKVLVLEARDRVGGRAKTIHLEDGKYWDVGGSFLGVGQNSMYKLANEYGIDVFPIPTRGKIVFYDRGRAKKYSGLIPPMRPWEILDMGIVLARLEKLVKQIDVDAPWKHPKAEAWDSITAEAWTKKHACTKGALRTMEMGYQAVFGRPGSEFSFLHALFVFKTLGSVHAAFSTHDGLQQDMMVGGGMAIADKIRQSLGADEVVRLNEPVVGIDYEADGSGCTVKTAKGQYQGKRVIVATPPQFAAKLDFNPPLPDGKKAWLEAVQLGAYSKVFATYKKPFWREKGLRGECTSLDGYLAVVFDATLPHEGAEGKLMAFATGAQSRELATLSDEERRRAALDEFARLVGPEALNPESFMYHSMLHDEWSGGCPLASPPPGVWISHGEWVRKQVGPIHWAGTESSTRFYGYMEGAVDAGRRAAGEVMQVLGQTKEK